MSAPQPIVNAAVTAGHTVPSGNRHPRNRSTHRTAPPTPPWTSTAAVHSADAAPRCRGPSRAWGCCVSAGVSLGQATLSRGVRPEGVTPARPAPTHASTGPALPASRQVRCVVEYRWRTSAALALLPRGQTRGVVARARAAIASTCYHWQAQRMRTRGRTMPSARNPCTPRTQLLRACPMALARNMARHGPMRTPAAAPSHVACGSPHHWAGCFRCACAWSRCAR